GPERCRAGIRGTRRTDIASRLILSREQTCARTGLRRYFVSSIEAGPFSALSTLKIQTSPPSAPTTKNTAPYNSATLMPSLVASPAYPKVRAMDASRTPHPAIEIG